MTFSKLCILALAAGAKFANAASHDDHEQIVVGQTFIGALPAAGVHLPPRLSHQT